MSELLHLLFIQCLMIFVVFLINLLIACYYYFDVVLLLITFTINYCLFTAVYYIFLCYVISVYYLSMSFCTIHGKPNNIFRGMHNYN